jgi:hypothetical protein
MTPVKTFDSLPGENLVRQGLDHLLRGELSTASLLVSIGAERLRRAGLDVPPAIPDADHRLYRLLAESYGDDAHSQYNGLLRRLVSFEQALECAK